MGSSPSYKEFGNSYDTTKVSQDKDSLKLMNHHPKKISHIRFYYQDENIVGFEWFYDGISTGARLGLEFK